MLDLNFWFMFPVGLTVATIAMMSGVGGATILTPLFLLVLKLEPTAALASGLFIEVFGFTSGIIGYARKKLIQYSLVKQILPYTILGTLIGGIASIFVPKGSIEIILALILGYLAIQFLRSRKKCQKNEETNYTLVTDKTKLPTTLSWFQKLSFGFGGSLFGISSSGLGEINEYVFLEKMKLKPSFASGTSVFIIAISALMAATFQSITLFLGDNSEIFAKVISIIMFSVPGVIIGAQLGVRLISRISSISKLETFLGIFYGTLSILIFSSILINLK